MPRLQAADRRRQLLEVAADLFAHRGFGGTTTAELAKGAGVTEPILYRHFANKLDLFITLIDQVGLVRSESAKRYKRKPNLINGICRYISVRKL